MKKSQGFWVGAILAVLLSSGAAFAAKSDPLVCEWRGGGPGGFPGPFGDMNMKVELSDDEMYVLEGKVVFLYDSTGKVGIPFLQINLEATPWLANSYRKAHPYYPLLGSNKFWHGYEGRAIEITARAEGEASYDANTRTATYDVGLMPITVYLIDRQ